MARPAPTSADRVAALEAENAGLGAEIERLEAELARLRESEKMYRSSAELGGRLVWAANAKGDITAMKMPFATVTGVAESAALGEGWLDVVHPEDRSGTRRRWREAVRTGQPYEAAFRARVADGSYRAMRSRAVPLRGEGQRIGGWYGTTEDVEDEWRAEQARRDAEERLRESEELHRHTLELSQQIVWTVHADGRLATISPRFRELTGLDDETPLHMAIHPDDRTMVLARWADSEAGGHPYHVQYRLRLADGSYRHMRARAAPHRDEAGQVLRWYGTLEDIHLEREADFARRDVEERYRLAGQATHDAIWDHDFVNGVIDWNDNAAAILGCAESRLGRTPVSWWEERLHPDERSALIQTLTDAMQSDARRWSGTYRFRRDDGSYADMLDRGFIIRDTAGRAIRAVGAMTDLTDRHRAEAEIRRMQAELVHVSRLSAMGAMASTLAHELNQPLTALANFISGARRIAERECGEQPALFNALKSAEAGALRAGEIVRRLRELVSRGAVSVLVEHLPTLIEDAGVLAFVDERVLGVRHRLELDPAAQWVRADRIQIQQVLINLVRNAVDAMEYGTEREVVISTRAIADDLVEIRVADTGPGIAPEHIDRLFSQFMTTKSGGMGIGLPISRTIVEAHGGTISGANRPEGGAVFSFTLPRARRRKSLPRL